MFYKLEELKDLKTSQYVYCLLFNNNKIKIGKTIHPYQRINAIITGSGEKTKNIFVIETDMSLETKAHQKYSKIDKSKIGEFYYGLNYREICDWLEQNKKEVPIPRDIDTKNIEKFIVGLCCSWELVDIYKQIDKDIPIKEGKDKITKSLNHMNKILKEIFYFAFLLKIEQPMQLNNEEKEQNILFTNYLDIMQNFTFISKMFGYKVANNWLFRLKKDVQKDIMDYERFSLYCKMWC